MLSITNFGFSYPFSQYKIELNGSFEINSGECILITGNSGSGKSTLLKALKGFIPNLINGNLHGEIIYKDRLIQEYNDKELLKIGYLQQNPDHQVVCKTVFAELAFGLENQQTTPATIQNKIVQIAQEFNIMHLLDKKISNLSGGEKQKINLLAILLMEPELLLLDEPTAFLDPDSAHDIIQILQKYIHNKTVIFIEHNTSYLTNVIDKVININPDGKIELLNKNSIKLQNINIQKLPYNKSEVQLHIRNLDFTYNNKSPPILKNINLTLHTGEIISIVGKNGTGKSTLLKLIAKILKSKQQIFMNNIAIDTIKDKNYWKNICLLWQNPENHFIYNKVIDEVNDINTLEKFNLKEVINNNPYNLSEGQKRRLSLAIALSLQCKIYLLDEPSFGQDYNNKQNLAQLIQEMAKNGASFIIISHDLDFSKAISHNTYHLTNGELCKN